ncbi:extracellular solute-binding protein [Rhizobiaceae bacterium BDR2-2]|uniref:Extracellular solute-binding protein n=1 Tax=Ectorhizobium quercum TaxID=2965071 RepID=A0AAE3N261_9HYPH|nr:extracellular solute-binding protein [Ectorhizobium quercum]MCX8999418.1 extracellular solute-binding protein [Ectorhizobium quercum]
MRNLRLAGMVMSIAALLGGGVALAAPAEEVVEGSKQENQLLVYSNMGTDNWNPILKAFNQHYPWIKVETLNLGASEPISRYEAETGTGNSSADFIVTGSIADWIRFADKKLASDYVSSEDAGLPDWSKPFPGIYTFSTDPMVLGYSKLLLTEEQQPDNFADFAKVVGENPALFKGKVGSYAVDGFGGSINWAFVRQHGDKAWEWLDAIGPSVKAGDGSGAMIEKLSRGEYTAVYFLSGPVIMPKMEAGLGQVIEWKYITDGTPVFMRGMAVTGKAKNVNSAKLLLDFILSPEGQIAVSEAGFMPYREGLPADQLRFDSLEQLKERIGEQNIITINYDPDMLTGFDAFTKRWAKAMGQ